MRTDRRSFQEAICREYGRKFINDEVRDKGALDNWRWLVYIMVKEGLRNSKAFRPIEDLYLMGEDEDGSLFDIAALAAWEHLQLILAEDKINKLSA